MSIFSLLNVPVSVIAVIVVDLYTNLVRIFASVSGLSEINDIVSRFGIWSVSSRRQVLSLWCMVNILRVNVQVIFSNS